MIHLHNNTHASHRMQYGLRITGEQTNSTAPKFVARLAVVILLVLPCLSVAQPIARPFPFTLSAGDTTQLSLLPGIEAGVAGSHGAWHLSPEGHFVAADGHRGKFFGTEIEWTANFIDSKAALVLAKRLRKMGFNALRLNYLDYFGWDDASMFQYYQSPGVPDTSSYSVNPLQLARFDTLLYTLKQNGIHVFLALNGVHHFSYGEEVPTWDSLYYNSYLAHFLYPQAAWLEHQWARTITAHVNPLTGIAIGKDPAVACYELLQDQSIPFYWQLNRLNYVDTSNALSQGLATISYHQSRRFDTLWTAYLQKKYGTDAALNAAWIGNANLDTRNVLPNGSFETIDNSWTLQLLGSVQAQDIRFGPGVDGSLAELVHIAANTGPSNPAAVLLQNYNAKCGLDTMYQLSFWAKIRPTTGRFLTLRMIYAIVTDQSNTNSLAATQMIDTVWREYRFPFRSVTSAVQLAGVLLSNDSGDVLFDNFILKKIPEQGLQAGESLAQVSVERLRYDTTKLVSDPRARDEAMFYDSLQRFYYSGMQRLLRDTLVVAGLVNASQGIYASNILDYHAFQECEVQETHTGWDYVSSNAAGQYSDSIWLMRNTPMVRDPGFYALGIATAGSIAGKSYVLGQWSVPHSNQHASEQAIMPVVYAAYQDWDGIFFSPYATRREELFADTIVPGYSSSWNEIVANHALMAQMPLASFVFRNGLVPPSTYCDTVVHDANDVFLFSHHPANDYRGPFGQDGFIYGDQSVISGKGVRERFDASYHRGSSYSHDYTDPIYSTYDSTATNSITLDVMAGTFKAIEPHLYAFTGFLSDSVVFPNLTIQRMDADTDNVSMYYVYADSQKNGLFSISTRTQNSGIQWIDPTTYGGSHGHAPTIMSAATLKLTFRSDFDSVLIYPLDPTGMPRGTMISAARQGKSDRFTATIDQMNTRSVWYAVREAMGTVSTVAERSESTFDVSISPNPSVRHAEVSFKLPISSVVRFALADNLGREVWKANGEFSSGNNRLSIDVSSFPSGIYLLRMTTSEGSVCTTLEVVR